MNTRNTLSVFDNFINDLSHDFRRSVIGFDHLVDSLRTSISSFDSYPPCNVEKYDNYSYTITFALAGFKKSDIEIVKEGNWLTISGKSETNKDETETKYLYRGIANRAFTRKIQLAENIEVKGAKMNDGLLQIHLERVVPEAEKPQIVEIK